MIGLSNAEDCICPNKTTHLHAYSDCSLVEEMLQFESLPSNAHTPLATVPE